MLTRHSDPVASPSRRLPLRCPGSTTALAILLRRRLHHRSGLARAGIVSTLVGASLRRLDLLRGAILLLLVVVLVGHVAGSGDAGTASWHEGNSV